MLILPLDNGSNVVHDTEPNWTTLCVSDGIERFL